jgi:predicted transcriptional regulator
MSQERQEILSILQNVGPKTPAQLAKILDKKRTSVKMILSRMKDSGLVKANEKGEYSALSF